MQPADPALLALLARIADALERASPSAGRHIDFVATPAFAAPV